MAVKKPIVLTSGQNEQLQSADSISGNGTVPAGGTANQVLSKIDATDFNLQWATPSGGSGSIGLMLMISQANYSL